MCISVFLLVGLVSRRELGGILCTIISLDILFTQFAIRWAGMWDLSRRGTWNRRSVWQKTLYIRWLMLCIIFLFPLSLSAGLLGGSLYAVGRTPRGLLPNVLINDMFFSRIWFLSGKTGLFCLNFLLLASLYTGCLSCQIGMMIYNGFCSSFLVLSCLRWVQRCWE